MKRIAAVLMAVSMMLMATSCSMIVKNNEEQFDYPVTVGNLTLSEAPKGIAVLSENLADVVLACGYEGKLSARSDVCTQEALSILPSVGTPDNPDMTELDDLGVDLILTDSCFDEEVSEKLEKHGTSVLVIKPATDIDSLSKLYNNTAAAVAGGYTGKMTAMNTFEKLRSALETVRIDASSGNVVSTACYLYDVSEDECVVAAGPDFVNQLFDYAAVTNVTAADDDGVVGIDTLLKSNPETIFCDEGVYEKLTANKDLKSLRALTQGTVYELPHRYIDLQGMTSVQIADYIAAKAHSGYTQKQQWPQELAEKKEEYKAPFEPQEDIFYTVGESYEPIKAIEERLIGLGYLSGNADESFTEETAAAVSEFQAANGLEVSGIADYNTLKVLLSSQAKSKDEAGEVTYSAE